MVEKAIGPAILSRGLVWLADPSQPGSYAKLLSGTNHSFTTGFAAGGTYNSILAANPNFTAPSVFSPDKNIHYPTYEEYSLQIQQQIGKSTSFQIGYVGNHGYHEPVVNNGVNTYGFGGAPAAPALPAFATVTEIQSANSNYNGLLLSVKNQSKYVILNINYTYSHALDEISNGGFLAFGINSLGEESPGNAIDPFNLALQNYGNADYDLRHSLTETTSSPFLISAARDYSRITGNWGARCSGTAAFRSVK